MSSWASGLDAYRPEGAVFKLGLSQRELLHLRRRVYLKRALRRAGLPVAWDATTAELTRAYLQVRQWERGAR